MSDEEDNNTNEEEEEENEEGEEGEDEENEEGENEESEKNIKWEYDLDIQISFAKTIHLYSITNSESTLCVLRLELLSIDENEIDYQQRKSRSNSRYACAGACGTCSGTV